MPDPNSDIARAALPWDVPAALVLLTRLPLPRLPNRAFAHSARAVWAYPIVGAVVGVVVAGLSAVATALGLPPMIVAGLCLGALVMLTGAMHEDGLADTADGLWGGHDPARRLEIMKDSRIGAYGVIALIVVLGLRWLGFAAVAWPALITALILSRAMMPPLMLALPHARADGLSRHVGTPPPVAVLAGALIGVGAAVALIGWAGLIAAFVAALAAAGIGALAHAKIGGQTGDILGATQIVTEIAVLLSCIAVAQ
ncbi:MAG: adenosylcobinamide-GDP ribazoletransferase [Pseudomonadota bacterium]